MAEVMETTMMGLWYIAVAVVILHWLFLDYNRATKFWNILMPILWVLWTPFDLLIWLISPRLWERMQ